MVRKRKNSTVRVGEGYSTGALDSEVTSHCLMTCGGEYPSRWRNFDRCPSGRSDGL
jgi:hypothetical protein